MKRKTTRDYVLERLEQNKGKYIKGASLAEELGLSRNAIWKAINELRDMGYEISSVNNRGYSLNAESDIISIQGIKHELERIGAPVDIADRITIYDELDSTNQTAKLDMITGSMREGIIIARRQSSGRGHGRSHYESPYGGIYMSIIIDPASLGGDVLRPRDIGRDIKKILEEISGVTLLLDDQFNRIYMGDFRVCGIMTEYYADMETNEINGYVVGIGISLPDIPKNLTIARVLSSESLSHYTSGINNQ